MKTIKNLNCALSVWPQKINKNQASLGTSRETSEDRGEYLKLEFQPGSVSAASKSIYCSNDKNYNKTIYLFTWVHCRIPMNFINIKEHIYCWDTIIIIIIISSSSSSSSVQKYEPLPCFHCCPLFSSSSFIPDSRWALALQCMDISFFLQHELRI